MSDETVLRKIGHKHGIAHAIVIVKSHIGRYGGPQATRINPRHVRKIKERDDILRPLRDIEKRLLAIHKSIETND